MYSSVIAPTSTAASRSFELTASHDGCRPSTITNEEPEERNSLLSKSCSCCSSWQLLTNFPKIRGKFCEIREEPERSRDGAATELTECSVDFVLGSLARLAYISAFKRVFLILYTPSCRNCNPFHTSSTSMRQSYSMQLLNLVAELPEHCQY